MVADEGGLVSNQTVTGGALMLVSNLWRSLVLLFGKSMNRFRKLERIESLHPREWTASKLVALRFSTEEEFVEAIKIFYEKRPHSMLFSVGQHAFIIQKRNYELIKGILKRKNLPHKVEKVVDASEIPPEERAKLRTKYLFERD